MDYMLNVVAKAVQIIETGEREEMSIFEEMGVDIYNYFASFQDLLLTTEKPYLLGTFYSYFESWLRDDENLHIIPVENAFYCFLKAMLDEHNPERVPAAMRMFVLMYDNGGGTGEIIHELFKRNFATFSGYDCTYEELMERIQRLNFVDRKFEQGKMMRRKNNIEYAIKSYCYSIFSNDQHHFFIDNDTMKRLNVYTKNYYEPIEKKIERLENGLFLNIGGGNVDVKKDIEEVESCNPFYCANALYDYLKSRIRATSPSCGRGRLEKIDINRF